jgi:uncharacterized protein
MEYPQEIEVWYILPAIRRQFALEMKLLKLKQKEIAKILNITEAAVSQYMKSKRAKEVNFPKEIKKHIKKSSKLLIKKPELLLRETMKILDEVKDCLLLCEIHKKHCNLSNDCCVCFEKNN